MTPSPSPSSSSSSADPQAIVLRPLTKCCSPASFKHFGCYSTTTTTTFYVLLLIALLPPAFSNAQKTSIGKPNKSRFTNAEIELIRRSFLKKFGMKEQPKQEVPLLPVPNYMWDIYEKVQNEEVEWVRHYYPQRIMESRDRLLLLRYNLTVSVQNATNERILRADLKLKLNRGIARRRVKVYEVDQRNPDIRRLLDSKQIEPEPKKDHQWVDMDVSEALTRRRPNRNRVDFAVELSDGHLTSVPSPSTSTVSAMPYSRTQAAALVVYVETNDEAAKVRRKRRAGGKRRHQHRKHNHRIGSPEKNLCQRRELHVDFNELNWQDWILAPPSYSAFQCQGECPNPLTGHFNTTNHAIVQGLINSVNPSQVPAPCCVPIEMESLAILYIDVESKIVIKNYPDMEVISCGCR
uniref:Protein decapentaplegic n=2 Tax=Ascaris TaxID=6251 RepID=F1KW68_ASCSU